MPEVHGTFSYANKQLTTDASVSDTAGKSLASIKGTVPIDLALSGVTGSRLLDLPINATLVSDSLPLELIPQFTPVVADVGGRALGNVTVGGTLKKPALKGNITLSEVHFKLVSTGAVLEHVNGSVRMTGDTVFVDSIAGIANGPVRLAGTVAVGNWREPAFDLTFNATDAQLLNNETGEVHADASLKIFGLITAPQVTGNVTVQHGVLYMPESRGKKVIGAGDPSLFSVVDTSIKMQRELFPGAVAAVQEPAHGRGLQRRAQHVGALARRERRGVHRRPDAAQGARRRAHAHRRGRRRPRRVHVPQQALPDQARLGAVHRHAGPESHAADHGRVSGEAGDGRRRTSGCSLAER